MKNSIKIHRKLTKMKRQVDLSCPEKIFEVVPGHNQGIQTLARDHIYPSKQSVGSYDVYFNLYYQKRELRVFFNCFSAIFAFWKQKLSILM